MMKYTIPVDVGGVSECICYGPCSASFAFSPAWGASVVEEGRVKDETDGLRQDRDRS